MILPTKLPLQASKVAYSHVALLANYFGLTDIANTGRSRVPQPARINSGVRSQLHEAPAGPLAAIDS